jgi:hypothetical protein
MFFFIPPPQKKIYGKDKIVYRILVRKLSGNRRLRDLEINYSLMLR